jgi:hypothetical protein
VLSSVTSDELPGRVPAGSIDTRGLFGAPAAGTWALAARTGEESAKSCVEPDRVRATSGTTMAAELLDTGLIRMSLAGAAEAGSMMPPQISATAGIADQILCKGNLMVRAPLPFDMLLLC